MRFDDQGIHIHQSDLKTMRADRPILDVCCGGKHFWFDPDNPSVYFMDIREMPAGTIPQQPNWFVKPDIVGDFRNIPFDDESFHLVVFDPPHVVTTSNGIITMKYGKLDETWREVLGDGFGECWRVLKPFGVLQFKFNDVSVSIQDVLACFPVKPLFGTKTKKGTNNTFWFTFMKGIDSAS